MKEDKYSYLMMFCALLLVRNSRASVSKSLGVVPLSQRVSGLAGEMAHLEPSADQQLPFLNSPGAAWQN